MFYWLRNLFIIFLIGIFFFFFLFFGHKLLCELIFFVFSTDDHEQDFDYLNSWGPRFSKLADMYGHDGESEEEERLQMQLH
jgi:hypothetical protein